MRLATLMLVAIVAGPAAAGPKVIPPAEYDHPYDGVLSIQVLPSQEEVRRRCPAANFNLGVSLACTYRRKLGTDWEMCVILKVSDEAIKSAGHDPETVLRHEVGHCNGWAADHRGAR